MNVRPKKSLGQHFLRNAGVVRRIVDAAALSPDDAAVEIGPGLGVLTRELASRCARLIAIEKDVALAERLRGELPGVDIRAGDALDVDWAAEARAAGRTLVLVGNLPYNVATEIVFRVIDARAHIDRAVFMVQREVAERLRAGPGTKAYGVLGVLAQAALSVELLFVVGPGSFRPPPAVESAVVRLRPVDRGLRAPPEAFVRVVRAAFGQRRKTLRNALAGVIDAETLSALGIDPTRRGETLTLEEFDRIASALGPSPTTSPSPTTTTPAHARREGGE